MYEIIVRAIIQNKNGAALLGKRAKPPEQNKWALIGGKVELKEKAFEAIKREVKEELNIDFKPVFEFYNENIFTNPDLHCLILYFSGKHAGKIRIKQDELKEVKYFSRKEIKLEKNIAWDHEEMLLPFLSKKQ